MAVALLKFLNQKKLKSKEVESYGHLKGFSSRLRPKVLLPLLRLSGLVTTVILGKFGTNSNWHCLGSILYACHKLDLTDREELLIFPEKEKKV